MMAGIGGNIAAMPLSEGGGGLRLELRPFCVRVHIEARDEACFAAEALVGATHLVCQICGTDVRFLALGAERRVALELSRGSGRLTIVPPATLVLMSAGEVVGFRGIDWFELYDEGLPAVEGYLEPEGVRA